MSTGNFSLFLLKNADSRKVAEVLNDLFRGSRSESRYGYGSSSRGTADVTVVADARMNALLVYGTTRDREVVEKMLDVLDAAELPDSLATERPRMIPSQEPAGRHRARGPLRRL